MKATGRKSADISMWLRRDGTLRKEIRMFIVHECGHALCAWRLGWRFLEMEIVAATQRGVPSCVRVRLPSAAPLGQGPVPPEKVQEVEDAIWLYGAGQIAVMLWGQWVDDSAWEKEQLHQPDTVEFVRLLRRLQASPGYRDRPLLGELSSMLLEPPTWTALVFLVRHVERVILQALRLHRSPTELERVIIAGRSLRNVLKRVDKVTATNGTAVGW